MSKLYTTRGASAQDPTPQRVIRIGTVTYPHGAFQAVALKLGISRQHVAEVAHHKRTSPRVQKALRRIAK